MVKIKYDYEMKDSIMNKLGSIVDDLDSVNNKLYNANIPYDYGYRNSFMKVRDNLLGGRKRIDTYKNNLNREMESISKDELELSSRMNMIEEVIVEK